MADQAEVAFLRVYLNTLTAQPVIYANEYQQPPQNSLKKVPVLQIAVPAPPRRSAPTSVASGTASTSSGITLTFKSLKPPASYTLSGVDPADSILALKQRLELSPNGPPVAAQRLLLKGKALADAKLVKEYPLANGDTVNLVLKPTPTPAPTTTTTTDITMSDASNLTPGGSTDRPVKSAAEAAAHPRRHTRIPSVVLSPAESPTGSPGTSTTDITLTNARDITLTLDADADHAGLPSEEISTYHAKLAEPEFWKALMEFLNSSFPSPADAARAWEDFLRASKNTLTASEVARIRDTVGVSGMAGT
ncbi:ubiquitin-domain-containing protein [Mycena sanguinolenta]|nr:ubiquitin-domain-containing protein [Mycena sanguinolenta]